MEPVYITSSGHGETELTEFLELKPFRILKWLFCL